MRSRQHVAVVGAGQAAARAIASMRDAGYAGAITLFGDEPELPYERPPLSKEALFGATDVRAATIFDEAFYRSKDVDVILNGSVRQLDPASGTVRFGGGRLLKADRLILATGARCRVAAIAGVDPERIFTLRSLADARRLKPLMHAGQRVVLLGGGFIGLELAAGASRVGCKVTVIEARPRVMERVASARVSALTESLHARNGVVIKTSCTVKRARQGSAETELTLSDGTACVADVIIAGIGALPNDELARSAGLACSNGVEVDQQCQTSSQIVWAVGDVAARLHPSWGSRVRIESWENAEVQALRAGRCVAASWSGKDCSLDAQAEQPAWFWTDQYELNLQFLGCVTDSDQTVARADRQGNDCVIFHFRDKVLRGVELICAGKERPLAKRLLHEGWPLAPEKLGDGGRTLKELVAARLESISPRA
jgi:3-phenylpropionate/trans-cinnamate dioxygenase ferredoxin reductase component